MAPGEPRVDATAGEVELPSSVAVDFASLLSWKWTIGSPSTVCGVRPVHQRTATGVSQFQWAESPDGLALFVYKKVAIRNTGRSQGLRGREVTVAKKKKKMGRPAKRPEERRQLIKGRVSPELFAWFQHRFRSTSGKSETAALEFICQLAKDVGETVGADRVRRLLEAEKRTGTRATYIIADMARHAFEAEELRVRAVKTGSPLGPPGEMEGGEGGQK